MDLVTGYPFWPLRDGLLFPYRSLDGDVRCQVAVVGAGVTGALATLALAQAGVDVVVVDERDVATGSTAASTCLVQYEIDTPLVDLAARIGADAARRAYAAAYRSIDALETIVRASHDGCGFARVPSFYAASRNRDLPSLQAEHDARRELGFDVDALKADEALERFGVASHGGLLSSQAAVLDAYRLTHYALHASRARVFSRTGVGDVRASRAGGVTLTTSTGHRIRADRVLFATGYETQRYLKRSRVTLKTTYATVSEPARPDEPPSPAFLFWETARPYFYARPGPEGRRLCGGSDDDFTHAKRRAAALPSKLRSLVRKHERVFPNRQFPFKPAYSWAGVFGESKDGLPFIGTCADGGMEHAYYAVGYGGNGITFSVIAAELIRDAFLKRENPNADLFCFDRPQ